MGVKPWIVAIPKVRTSQSRPRPSFFTVSARFFTLIREKPSTLRNLCWTSEGLGDRVDISATIEFPLDSERPAMVTLCPSEARARAMPCPILFYVDLAMEEVYLVC